MAVTPYSQPMVSVRSLEYTHTHRKDAWQNAARWRLFFWLGAAPALLALWIAMRVQETPVWLARHGQKTPAHGERSKFGEKFSQAYFSGISLLQRSTPPC